MVTPWKFILATLAIFTAGIVTGGLMVGYGYRQANRNSVNVQPPHSRPSVTGAVPVANTNSRNLVNNPLLRPQQQRLMSVEFVDKLDAEVRLTEAQREHILQVITEGQQRNKELWDRINPELRHEMMESQRRIREILTETQRPRFEELMKQRQPKRVDEPGKMHRTQPTLEDRSTQAYPAAPLPNKP